MSGTIKAKHQRLVLITIALAALIAAGLLAAWALRSQASYFYLPSEMSANPPATDRAVRLGGMVDKGSLKTASDGVTITFLVSDDKGKVPVRFRGISPTCSRKDQAWSPKASAALMALSWPITCSPSTMRNMCPGK